MKQKISITLAAPILKRVDSLIDRLFVRNRSQAIELMLRNALDKDRTAVILAGGPEEKIRINSGSYYPTAEFKGAPVVERAIRKLRSNRFKTIFVVARKNVLTDIFRLLQDGAAYGVKIHYIEEKKSTGTADSLRLVKGKINSTFLVVYGDILFEEINLEDLWDFHLKNSSLGTLLLTTFSKPSLKGVVELEGTRVVSFNQKPKTAASYIVFSSVGVCEPELLNYSGSSLEEEVFVALAKKGLINGYVSKNKVIHIHDVLGIKKP